MYYIIWWYIRCRTQYGHDIAPMNPCRCLRWYSVYSLLHHILINIRCVMGVVELNHLLVPCVFLYCLQNIPLSIIHVYRIHVLFNILSINCSPLIDCIVSSIDSAGCAWFIVVDRLSKIIIVQVKFLFFLCFFVSFNVYMSNTQLNMYTQWT